MENTIINKITALIISAFFAVFIIYSIASLIYTYAKEVSENTKEYTEQYTKDEQCVEPLNIECADDEYISSVTVRSETTGDVIYQCVTDNKIVFKISNNGNDVEIYVPDEECNCESHDMGFEY